jgi:hypothetical protein
MVDTPSFAQLRDSLQVIIAQTLELVQQHQRSGRLSTGSAAAMQEQLRTIRNGLSWVRSSDDAKLDQLSLQVFVATVHACFPGVFDE